MSFTKATFWMSAASSVVAVGVNLTAPAKGKRQPMSDSQKKMLEVAAHGEKKEKRYVKIDNKIFEYNPKNVYQVNGVATYYKPPKLMNAEDLQVQKVAATPSQAQGQINNSNLPSENLEKVQRMVDSGPLAPYSPGGVQAIMDGANEAKAKMEEHNRALNQLMNE